MVALVTEDENGDFPEACPPLCQLAEGRVIFGTGFLGSSPSFPQDESTPPDLALSSRPKQSQRQLW